MNSADEITPRPTPAEGMRSRRKSDPVSPVSHRALCRADDPLAPAGPALRPWGNGRPASRAEPRPPGATAPANATANWVRRSVGTPCALVAHEGLAFTSDLLSLLPPANAWTAPIAQRGRCDQGKSASAGFGPYPSLPTPRSPAPTGHRREPPEIAGGDALRWHGLPRGRGGPECHAGGRADGQRTLRRGASRKGASTLTPPRSTSNISSTSDRTAAQLPRPHTAKPPDPEDSPTSGDSHCHRLRQPKDELPSVASRNAVSNQESDNAHH